MKPTPIVDAAEKAFIEPLLERDGVIAALRSACPKEPQAEWVEAMASVIWEQPGHCVPFSELDAMNRVRCHNQARSAYRALPLWCELWGDE